MKKFILSVALALFAFAAFSQSVVSDGYYTKSTTHSPSVHVPVKVYGKITTDGFLVKINDRETVFQLKDNQSDSTYYMEGLEVNVFEATSNGTQCVIHRAEYQGVLLVVVGFKTGGVIGFAFRVVETQNLQSI